LQGNKRSCILTKIETSPNATDRFATMFSHPIRSLFLIALGHLTIELSNNFLPVVYPVLIDSLGLTYSQIGTIAFVAGASTSLTQPLFGLLSDRWQPYLITVLSIAWSGVFMALVGFTRDYLSLALVVGLGALGSAAFHPSGATIAALGAGARRGTALSIFSVGGNFGAALSPLWVTAGIGWLGAQGTVLLIPVALGVSLFLYRQLERVQRPAGQPTKTQKSGSKEWSPAWLILIVAAMMFRAWFQASFMTYLPTWVQTQGRPLTAGGHMLFVFLTSVGIGSLIGGALSDRIGRWQVLVLSLSLIGPTEWVFLNISGAWQMTVLGAMGILLGSTFPVSIVLAQEVWPHGAGVASGLVIGLPWIGGGVGASLTGMIADASSLTVGLQSLIVPAILAAGSVLAYAILPRRRAR
jgi:FSR family fosmidomycin resistance protein-like MFS transporter